MLYQVVEGNKNIYNAGSKATADVSVFAEELGFVSLYVHPIENKKNLISKIVNQLRYFMEWKEIYKNVEENSTILLQHPFRNNQFNREKLLKKLKEKKKVKFISLIHDVEELRNSIFNNHYRTEFEFMLDIADYIIVHNERMKNWFVDKGIDGKKLICLEVFDYLTDSPINEKTFSNNVTIAGNLDSNKSAYLSEIYKVNGLNFDLYGVNYNEENYLNINYHGSFMPEELSKQFKSGFGLVWDGTSINTCNGNTGNYLRYNNPHKLSLYVSSGLPIIIWKDAALAQYVVDKGIGIGVDSLMHGAELIRSMTIEEYNAMCQNVNKESDKLRKGYYIKQALKTALDV